MLPNSRSFPLRKFDRLCRASELGGSVRVFGR
jgi:hypothetical protein